MCRRGLRDARVVRLPIPPGMRTMSKLKGTARRRGDRRRPVGLGFERAEARLLLASYVVINTSDGGIGSLRAAIQYVDANPPSPGQTDVITFDISGTGPFVISPASALPTITVPVIIDGTS